MKKIAFIVLIIIYKVGISQPAIVAANDAFLITRLASKHHIQPIAIDERFSNNLFTTFINQIDKNKIFFTQEDIKLFNSYKYQLHIEVLNKKTSFLQTVTNTYQKRLQQVDSFLTNILKQPTNFLIDEKYTVFIDTNYAENTTNLYGKIAKQIKIFILTEIVEQNKQLLSLQPNAQKKFVDSIEASYRKKVIGLYKRYVQKQLNAPGGIAQLIANKYCKSIANLYDPHTTYMTVTDKENFEGELGNKVLEFGFALQQNENGTPVVEDLKPGSPAFKSGMMNKGDKIISIQWDNAQAMDVSDASVDEIYSILSASNHNQVTITIQKADGTKRQVTLNKEIKENDDEDDRVRSFILQGDKKIGYISLPSFYEDWELKDRVNGCANDVAKEIIKLKKDNIQGLIFDIRYNGGGSMLEAIDLAGIFIDAGPIVQLKTRNEKPTTLKDINRGTIYDGPMLLMVNGYSASASELLAGTLQDYNRAIVVGTKTFGKATGQRVLPLDSTINLADDLSKKTANSYLKLTLSQLFRVNGQTAQFEGVKPDIHILDATEILQDKERNTPFAIATTPIDPNKYYQPLKAINLTGLQTVADAEQKKDSFFFKLQQYEKIYNSQKTKKDMPLKLSEFLKFMANEKTAVLNDDDFNEIDEDETATSNNQNLYSVANNSFEIERVKANSNVQKNDKATKKHLASDSYIKICYLLLKQLIK